MRSRFVRSALIVSLFAFSACSGGPAPAVTTAVAESVTADRTPTTKTEATVGRAEPGGILTPGCDDEAACATGFILDDGVFYALGCSVIRESAVTDQVVGQGDFYGEWVTVNLIEGVPDRLLVAVSQADGLCANGGEEPLSDWAMAFPVQGDGDAVLEALCRVGELSTREREANGC